MHIATHSLSLKQKCDVAENRARSSATDGSGDERNTSVTNKEDLEQNTADIHAVMQRHVLVIQKAQSTVDIPLLQYIDSTVQKTARGLHGEVQRNPDGQEDACSIDGCSQTKLTCQEHVPERIVEQTINTRVTVDFGRDRCSDKAGPT